MAAAGLWIVGWLYPDIGADIPDTTRMSIILFAASTAILPATAGAISSARSRQDAINDPRERHWLRRHFSAVVGIVLVFVALAGVRLVGPGLERYDLDRRVISVQQWVTDRWARWEDTFNGLWDELYIRYYDRRAPAGSTPVAPSTEENSTL